jgi:DNA-binding PadR family transcriptional regulator
MDKSLALLGLVDSGATHGYDLKHRYDEVFGRGRPIAFGQVYAVLARMIRDGHLMTLGEEAGAGPDRKRYAITEAGRARVRTWLATPDAPAPDLVSNLFAKVVLACMLEADADELLDVQRMEHLARMRELTHAKQAASLLERLAIDSALFHLEADLRWIDMTSARLNDMQQEIRHHG